MSSREMSSTRQKEAKDVTSQVLGFFLGGLVGGMSEASSGSGSPQSSTGLSNREVEVGGNHMVMFLCKSRLEKKKKICKGTHLISVVWQIYFCQKKGKKKKIEPAMGARGMGRLEDPCIRKHLGTPSLTPGCICVGASLWERRVYVIL